MNNHIKYHLSRTVKGPKINVSSPKEGFDVLYSWLTQNTIGKINSIILTLQLPAKNYPILQFLDDAFKRIDKVSTTITNSEEELFHICEWKVEQSVLTDIFKIYEENNLFFMHYNFVLQLDVEFILLDEQALPLKEQSLYAENHSSILAFIRHESISIEPSIYFPFENNESSFQKYYSAFSEKFPFKLSEKNLYKVEFNKSRKLLA